MKQTFLDQSLSVRLRWVVAIKTLTRVWNPGFYYSFVSFSVSWFGYGKIAETEETKEQWNPTPSRRFIYSDLQPQVFRFIPALRGCDMIMFKASVHVFSPLLFQRYKSAGARIHFLIFQNCFF